MLAGRLLINFRKYMIESIQACKHMLTYIQMFIQSPKMYFVTATYIQDFHSKLSIGVGAGAGAVVLAVLVVRTFNWC